MRTIKFAAAPLTATTIAAKLRSAGIGRATLFRVLKRLLANGEIAAIEDRSGATAYVGHAYHQAVFRCQRCGKERTLTSRTLPTYVDRKMFGHQAIVTSQLIAQGLCGSCARKGPSR